MRDKIVLAYSGGLDTSIIIPWLHEHYDADVIAYVGDVGQGDDLDAVVDKAYATGASRVIVEDLRDEFVTEFVFPAIRAGAVYEHKYLLGTSLARPLIAKHQVHAALREGATAVAHGCTGKGNDQVRFEMAYQAIAPELRVIAPWREWELKSREDCLAYAEEHGIPVAQSRAKIHSRDRNLLHLSHEGGELEDPNNPPLETTWQWTRSPQEAADQTEIVDAKGRSTSIDGVTHEVNVQELGEPAPVAPVSADDGEMTEGHRRAGWSKQGIANAHGAQCAVWQDSAGFQLCVWTGGRQWGYSTDGMTALHGGVSRGDSIVLWAHPGREGAWKLDTREFSVGKPLDSRAFSMPKNVAPATSP